MNNCDTISRENKTVFIVGPTAVGKTYLAHNLAKKLKNAEIVSADSMQIYEQMEIVSAKPTIEQRNEVPYHMIDFLNISTKYTLSDFYTDASDSIEKIISMKKIPIVVGGTGLYIRTLLKGIFDGPDNNPDFRKKMQEIAGSKGVEYLHNLLKKIDPESAGSIQPNNVRRVIRALEVYEITGEKISSLKTHWNKPVQKEHPKMGKLFLWGICSPRKNLYDRINNRIYKMIEDGLINEVENLVKMGIMNTDGASQALGVKEIAEYLKGNLSKETAIELLKRNTRRFAKRQLTWFAKEPDFKWYITYKKSDYLSIVDEMVLQIRKGVS